MAYLLEKEEVCPSTPKKKRSMTMATFFFSSLEICEEGNGLCHGKKLASNANLARPINNSLDALQDQDPPPACRLRRRRQKLVRSLHGPSSCHSRVMLPGHSGGGGQLSTQERKKMTMAIALSLLGLRKANILCSRI